MQSQYVVSPQNMPMNDKIGHASFGHSANYSQPSYIAQGTVGVEVASTIPASYTNVNSYNSASSVTFNPSRVNKNSAILHTPVQTSAACFLPPAQLQNFGNTCTLPNESKSIVGQLHVDKFSFEDTWRRVLAGSLVTNDAVKERKNDSAINYSVDPKAEQSSTLSESPTSREEDLSMQKQDKHNKNTTLDLSNKEETLETNLSMFVVADSRTGTSELVSQSFQIILKEFQVSPIQSIS